jgi:hypothetical protein
MNNCILKHNQNDEIAQIFNRLIDFKFDYSKNLKEQIITFYTNHMDLSNCSILSFVLKNKKYLSENFNIYLNNYILSFEDFLEKKDNEKIILFRTIITDETIEKKLSNSFYLNSCKSIAYIIASNICEGNIIYKSINPLYSKKDKKVLNERISLISLNKEEEALKIKNKLDEYMNKTNAIFKDLEEIHSYLKLFFAKTHKDAINKINNLTKTIFNNNINYYTNIYQEYEELKKEYKKASNENLVFKDSNLFILMNKNIKKFCGFDEEKSFTKAKRFIELLEKILKENKIKESKVDINELENYSKLININEEELSKEIDKLVVVLNIQKKVDSAKISKGLIALGQKNKMEHVVNILLNFIEKLNLVKTQFYSLLLVIKKNSKSKDVKILELSKSILSNYNIDLDNDDSKFVEHLIDLEKNPDKIKFLSDNNEIRNDDENNFPSIREKKYYFSINKYSLQFQDKEIMTILKDEIDDFDDSNIID